MGAGGRVSLEYYSHAGEPLRGAKLRAIMSKSLVREQYPRAPCVITTLSAGN